MIARDPSLTVNEAEDHQLTRRVVNYLHQRHRPSLRRVHVESQRGEVVLRGKLQSFYEKQLCLNACQRVAGVLKIVDELDVS